MNRITIIGHMAKDPELQTTQSGISRCTFTVAVQRRFKNQDGKREADFLPVVAWRQTADFAAKYLTKGRLVAVDGSVQTRSYTGQDGSKRYMTEIIAENVEPLGSPNKAEAPEETTTPDGMTELPADEDLPF